MSEIDVEAIRAMLDSITQGEWRACHDGDCSCGMVFAEGNDILVHTPGNHEDHDRVADDDHIKDNARFIAAAPYTIRAMLNEIVALRKQVEDQRLELCRYDDAWCETDEERQLRPRS